MSKFLAGLGGGTTVAATATVGALVVAGVAWVQLSGQDDVEATPVVTVETPVQPTVDVEAKISEAPVEVVDTPVEIAMPAFDEVRRETDGMTVIAGRGEPGALIQILQNGVEIATAKADGSGKFAALMMIPPDGKGHVLSLVQVYGDKTFASLDEIILAPLAAPVVVAETSEPEAKQPEVQTETAQVEAPVVAEVVAGAKVVEDDVPTPTPTPTPTPEDEAGTGSVESAGAETSEVVTNVEISEAPTVPDATKEVLAAVETVEPAIPEEAPTVAEPAIVIAAAQAPEVIAPAEETVVEDSPAEEIVAEDIPTKETVAEEISTTEVSEPQSAAVAVLKSTAVGVELLNPDAPEVMDNVALDTISYSELGDVQLSGRAQANTRAVRVYLNNDAVVSLDVASDGRWRGDLPNVDEGIYTLRVDEVATDGSVSSRVETPFKREAPEVLAAASAAQTGQIKAITVQKGATLWAIARERYGSGELYVRVFEANKDSIRDADLIYPGQIFDLPD